MGRNMYSLILMDELVGKIDRLAYRQGTSRSNYINRLLAEHLSFTTPEKQIEDIFSRITGMAQRDDTMRIMAPASGNMIQLKSVLHYKYNPTIRFTVEIMQRSEGYRGAFRVQSRTQSEALKELLSGFFQGWVRIEQHCLASAATFCQPQYELTDGRLWRSLRIQRGDSPLDSQILGEEIGDYMQLFNNALEQFFKAGRHAGDEVYESMVTLYKDYLKSCRVYL